MKRTILIIMGLAVVLAVLAYAATLSRVVGPQAVAASTSYASEYRTPVYGNTFFVVSLTGGGANGRLLLLSYYNDVAGDTVALTTIDAATGTMRYAAPISADSLRKAALPALDSNQVARNYILSDTSNFRYRIIWKEYTTGTHSGTVTAYEGR